MADSKSTPTEADTKTLTAAEKKAHEMVRVVVTHENGWPYRGTHMPHDTPLAVPRYVLDGNPEFIKEQGA